MKYANYIGAAAAVLVIISAFLPWIYIESRDITVTGLVSTGTNFGKPAYAMLVLSGCAFLMFLIPKVWAKRTNVFFSGANLAWAFRNLLLLSVCDGGDCPVRKYGLILALIASAVMLVMALFPDMKLPVKK